jgi:hypothetical protein
MEQKTEECRVCDFYDQIIIKYPCNMCHDHDELVIGETRILSKPLSCGVYPKICRKCIYLNELNECELFNCPFETTIY